MVKDINPMRVICGSCGALYGAGKLARLRSEEFDCRCRARL